jgi:hypothetical protein
MELDESIIPDGTALKEFSDSLAIKGIAAIVRLNTAALEPIIVPITRLVTGIKRITRIINGIDLKIFTIRSSKA